MAMIREMPAEEKPREKALHYGIETLSSRELLAILLRTGRKGKSALELADEILHKGHGFAGIANMSVQQLCTVNGISTAKALQIQACFELNRRVKREMAMEADVIHTPGILIDWLQSEIGTLMQERMLAVYLDSANHIIRCEDLFRGTIDSTGIYPREIFRNAVVYGSTHVIVVHNHPSGSIQPSEADIDATERIAKAGRLMGIRVIDHIIITRSGYFSFLEHGLMVE